MSIVFDVFFFPFLRGFFSFFPAGCTGVSWLSPFFYEFFLPFPLFFSLFGVPQAFELFFFFFF